MITAICIKNFKVLEDTGWIPLTGNVVFVGPNNSGKTTALQAFALWNYGIQKWIEKQKSSKAVQRIAAVINRKDLFAIPISSSRYIWTNLFFSISERGEKNKIKGTKDNKIEITVKGVNTGKEWICGLEFRYGNEETIYVKPLQGLNENTATTDVNFLNNISVAFLPPMSGLKLEEEKLLFSTVEYRMGEGRTAEVLGNLCYQVIKPENEMLSKSRKPEEDWLLLTEKLKKLFLIKLLKPEINNKGIINLKYLDANNNELEIISSGRGMQQIILLLSYLLIKPNCIILLDEPDAHLEILKQEQVYELLTEIASLKGSQLFIASHSEIVLRKAVSNDDHVIAFYPASQPKFINDRGSELLKSLRIIGFDEYYLAHQYGWILYLEGTTDIAILRKFAIKLNHPVLPFLENCYLKTINCNDPNEARKHYSGLKDAKKDLIGIVVYDNISNPLNTFPGLAETMWKRNEIENYFFSKTIFMDWAKIEISNDLFGSAESLLRQEAMLKALDDVLPGAANRDENHEYWAMVKASSEIEKILKAFYSYLGQKGDTSKARYVDLIKFLSDEKIDNEVIEKLDFILKNIPAKSDFNVSES